RAIVGIFPYADLGHDLFRVQINDSNFAGQVFSYVKALAIGRGGNACWKSIFTRAPAPSFCTPSVIKRMIFTAAKHQLARRRSLSAGKIEEQDFVVVTTRHIKSLAVRRKLQTEPRFFHADVLHA